MWALLRRVALLPLRRNYGSKVELTGEEVFKQKVREAELARKQNAPEWHKRDESLRKRYGAWNPTRKLSREQMNSIKEMKAMVPHMNTKQIADHFGINPESIRRILKSKWVPSEAEAADVRKRAEKRKEKSTQRKIVAAEERGQAPKKHRLHGRPRPQRKTDERRRKPYTEGVGDLIE